MSGSRNLTNDVDIDISRLFSIIWKKKILLLLVSLISAALIFVAFSMVSPRYKSDAQILIKKRESIFTRINTNQIQPNGGEFDEQAVGSQVLVLQSDDLAKRVIAELDLTNHVEFQASGNTTGILYIIKSLMGGSSSNADLSVTASSRILKQFRKQLLVYTSPKSRVIIVEFWSRDRNLARDVPNKVAEIYLETTKQAKFESDEAATNWLGPEIDELRENVRKAEKKVAQFRSNSDILLGNNNALLATQQLSEVSSELSRVRAGRGSAEAKIDSIRLAIQSGGSVDVIPEVIASPLVQRLRERQVALRGQISQLSTTLLPDHPQIKALQSQLPEINRQITIAAQNILTSLENNVNLARKQESILIQEVNRLKAESSRVGEAEVKLRALEREATAQRTRLESYLGRFNEAESRRVRGYVPEEARIIEHATLPAGSYFPKVVPFTLAGFFATMLLTCVFFLAGQLLSGRAYRQVMPAREVHSPDHMVVANAPSIAPQTADLQIAQEQPIKVPSNVANDRDIFDIGFAQQAIEGLGNASVAIVSPDTNQGGEQGSQAVCVLARYLSGRGHNVVAVDFTGDGASTNTLLRSSNVPGMNEVMNGVSTLREVLFKDELSNAHVLASGNHSAGGLDFTRLPKIIDVLEKTYEFVLYDCGQTESEGLARIASSETVIIVPTVNTNFTECKKLETKLKSAGFGETILISMENSKEFNIAVSAA